MLQLARVHGDVRQDDIATAVQIDADNAHSHVAAHRLHSGLVPPLLRPRLVLLLLPVRLLQAAACRACERH